MKTYLTYGAAMAIANAIVVLGLFFAGFHSDGAKLDQAQWIAVVGGLGISVACIVLGTKARLSEMPLTVKFGYSSALGTAVMIVLFAALFGVITNLAYFQIINPGFNDLIVQAQLDKMSARGMSAAQIEQAEKITRMIMKPALQSVFSFFGALLTGTIVSLVTSAFLKRPAIDDSDAEIPPSLS